MSSGRRNSWTVTLPPKKGLSKKGGERVRGGLGSRRNKVLGGGGAEGGGCEVKCGFDIIAGGCASENGEGGGGRGGGIDFSNWKKTNQEDMGDTESIAKVITTKW